MKTLLESLEWRYATKKYDPTKKVVEADIQALKKAIQYSPSSMGLQPYKVIVVSNPEVKVELAKHGMGNKSSIEDASHLFVFAAIEDLGATHVSEYMKEISAVRGVSLNDLQGFQNVLEGVIVNNTTDQNQIWISKQIYLALGNLLTAAADLRIDATPMEGFDPAAFDAILGLSEKGLKSVVIATVGYRSEEDGMQFAPKVRKPEASLFIEL